MVSAKKSNKAKGDKAEKEVQEHFIEKGFITMRSPRTMKIISPGRYISKDNDYFNLYDICAKSITGFTVWIQVKVNQIRSTRKKIQEFHDKYMGKNESSEIWMKIPYKGYVCYCYNQQIWRKYYTDTEFNKINQFRISGEKRK